MSKFNVEKLLADFKKKRTEKRDNTIHTNAGTGSFTKGPDIN